MLRAECRHQPVEMPSYAAHAAATGNDSWWGRGRRQQQHVAGRKPFDRGRSGQGGAHCCRDMARLSSPLARDFTATMKWRWYTRAHTTFSTPKAPPPAFHSLPRTRAGGASDTA